MKIKEGSEPMTWIVLIAAIIGIVYFVVKKKDEKSPDSGTKPVVPYPMDPDGASNPVIGMVDRFCELAAFCEKYVIPMDRFKPDPVEARITVSASGMRFAFTWKTDFSALDTVIEKQGYSIRGEGFHFSDSTGRLSYERMFTALDPAVVDAWAYVNSKAPEWIASDLEGTAEANFISLGLSGHSASCRSTLSDSATKEFFLTV